MALLALSKCRLCLKLGDFYSIFTEDNSLQLARMAMACSDIQIHEGDGLPDKVCGECVEKLSSAYIFKQQCERSDAELRKSINNSGLKNTSIRKYEPSLFEKSPSRSKNPQRSKRKHDEIQNTTEGLLEERYSVDVSNTLSLEATQTNTTVKIKKRRLSESSNSCSTPKEKNVCKFCNKTFKKSQSLYGHLKIHRFEMVDQNNGSTIDETEISQNEDTPNNSHLREGEKYSCDSCGDQYHNRVLFNDHVEQCKSEDVEEKNAISYLQKLLCPICRHKYKKRIYLRKHLGRSSCGVELKKILGDNTAYLPSEIHYSPIRGVQCSNCDMKFRSHAHMVRHFFKCLQDKGINNIRCISCDVSFSTKNNFFRHMKRFHIIENLSVKKNAKGKFSVVDKKSNDTSNSLECNKCNKSFETQTQLVMHLAAHMVNINDNVKDSYNQNLKCMKCGEKFRYKSYLRRHLKSCHKNLPSDLSILDVPSKANQCDLCGKSFKYAKSLTWHKNTKHPTIDDSLVSLQRRGIEFSKCPAKCLHCDLIFDNEYDTKMHNRVHIEKNVKVKNEYTCPDCDLKFTNTKIFRLHIKDHNDQMNYDDTADNDDVYDASISNYCEVTSNIVDEDVDVKPCIDLPVEHNPVVELNGITCSICNKKLESVRGYHLHMRTHNKGSKAKKKVDVSCFVCQKRFSSKEEFQMHMKIHYHDDNLDPSLLKCSICKRQSKNMRAYIAHMSWHTFNGRFKCHMCEEKFPYFKLYKNHMEAKHQINIDEFSRPTNFQCYLCKKYFENNISLQYHILCHQKDNPLKDDKYECVECKEEFATKYLHLIHMQSHHRVFPTMAVPRKKFSKVTKKITKIVCPVCDVAFVSRVRLNRHLNAMHPVKKMVKKSDPDAEVAVKHICILCTKEFPSDERLQTHMSLHKRKPDLYQCTLCLKKSLSLKTHLYHIKGHLLKQHKDKPIRCDKCDKHFIRRQELRIHLKQSHDIVENYVQKIDKSDGWKSGDYLKSDLQEHQCHVCGKVLRNESTYHKHIAWHNTRRCNYCFTYFEKKTFLLAHVMYNCDKKKLIGNSDQFDKKLKCHICLKQFSILVKLHCHLKVQHNADPIGKDSSLKCSVCDFCLSVFGSEERMLSHRKVHFHSGIMKCTICSKLVRHMSYFKNHKVRHFRESYEDNPLNCEHCNEKFISMYVYVKHLRTIHKSPMVWLVPQTIPVEKCSICNKEFTHLERHMMYHDKYKCKKCNQYFMSEVLYNDHFCEFGSEDDENTVNNNSAVEQNITSNEQSFEECKFCFKPITSMYSKAKHDLNHSKIVYFFCRLCDRRFFMKSAFNIHSTAHRLQHFKKNPLRCRHCGESFTRYQHYTEHIRQVHDDQETMEFHLKPSQPKECLICKKTFVNLHRHYKYHLALKCRLCSKYILSQKLFTMHNCNDDSEDSNLVVQYDGDIAALSEPDFSEWENERMVEAIPRNDSDNTDIIMSDDHQPNHSMNSFSQNSNSTSHNYQANVNSLNHLNFNSFAPIISSTVSLSSSTVERDTNSLDVVNIQVKSEPIDQYYKDYHYDFQNSFTDLNNRSG